MRMDTNDCSDGKIAGGLLGGGLAGCCDVEEKIVGGQFHYWWFNDRVCRDGG